MAREKISSSTARIVGEFVLIVLGVLSALTVDTWIEQRNDDELRQQYLVRLSADLKTDLQNLEYRISFFNAVHSFGLQTIQRLQTGEAIDREAILSAYYASEVFAFVPVKNTYVDLQSTGNIRLLRDVDVRLALTMYYNANLASNFGTASTQVYRQVVRGIIPWEIQALIKADCPTVSDMNRVPTGFQPCPLDEVSTKVANDVFSALRDYPRIIEILTHRVSEVSTLIFLYDVQKQSALEVLAKL
jgi:hypothetical protein